MPKVYYYKLTIDNGGAPSVQGQLLTLAICKPTIRRCAQPGDWVVGFGAKSFEVVNRRWPNGRFVPGQPLVFMARVTSKLGGGKYYLEPRFVDRPDCIYERHGSRFQRRADALYHPEPECLPHDLGSYPVYEKADVLISDDFRYYADGGTFDYELQFPSIKDAFERIHRMHGVAQPNTSLSNDFMALQRWLWRQHIDASAPFDAAELPLVNAASRTCTPTSATRARVEPKMATHRRKC